MLVGLAESAAAEHVTVMRSYVDAVRRGGHFPLVLPATADAAEALEQVKHIDVLLLLGGGDWGDVPARDDFERLLFAAARMLQKPVLGICRGMQVINLCMGGTLIEDIPQPQGAIHQRPDSKWAPVHPIHIVPNSRLAKVLQTTDTEVNSTHHQALRDVAPGLRVVARSADGIIEAIEAMHEPIAGVQFHPERLAWGDDVCFTRLFTYLAEWAGH